LGALVWTIVHPRRFGTAPSRLRRITPLGLTRIGPLETEHFGPYWVPHIARRALSRGAPPNNRLRGADLCGYLRTVRQRVTADRCRSVHVGPAQPAAEASQFVPHGTVDL
jgi:hypothetical protein